MISLHDPPLHTQIEKWEVAVACLYIKKCASTIESWGLKFGIPVLASGLSSSVLSGIN